MMVYRLFEVPEYHEFMDSIGVGPELVEGEQAQRLILESSGELMIITFDVPGRSIHCRWSSGSRVLMEVFHEGAVRLRLGRSAGTATIDVDIETDSSAGRLTLITSPEFGLRDRILLR
jgi:hypothetical protein